jgi:carbamoylphosphate synthase small subunit
MLPAIIVIAGTGWAVMAITGVTVTELSQAVMPKTASAITVIKHNLNILFISNTPYNLVACNSETEVLKNFSFTVASRYY